MQQSLERYCEVYQHWFALEVYKLYVAPPSAEHVSLQFCNEIFTIEKDSLDSFFGEAKIAVSSLGPRTSAYFSIADISSRETTHTALLCRSLDRFLFPDEMKNKGACCHQLPTGVKAGKAHPADFFVVSLKNGVPTDAVLVGDYKIHHASDKAFHETVGYCIEAANMYKNSQRLVLGLAATSEEFKLLVCQNRGDGKFLVIKAISCSISNKTDFVKFACVLYASVHYLCRHPIIQSPATTVAVKCKDGGDVDDHVVLNHRVVLCKKSKRVHKFYDRNEYADCRHNFELIEKLGLLPNASLMNLSEDERFQQLSYDYLEPIIGHAKLEDFKLLTETLSKLHGRDIVHSDVRCENIVFTKNGAWLVDFDLADKENKPYPELYNGDGIAERHEGARSGMKRKKIHDRFSLCECIERTLKYIPKKLEERFLSDEVPLDDIVAQWMK